MIPLFVAMVLSASAPQSSLEPTPAPGAVLAPVDAERPLLDLNTATIEQLRGLPGIGPKKALAIIALRDKRPFVRVSQLLAVKGIGQRTLQRLKPLVTVKPTQVFPVHRGPKADE